MQPRRAVYAVYVKPTVDRIFAAVGLVVCAPLMLAIAAAVRLALGSPVFFKQVRPGKDCRLFTVYKFRTMTDARDSSEELLPDGMRLTRLGKLLRLTSLDELPQLLNIVRGEMSFIGPRPLLFSYLPYYTARERIRHTVRPGITGLAQINGRNALQWDARLALDVEYVERISVRLDLEITMKTIAKVLRRSGVTVNTEVQSFGPLSEYRRKNKPRQAA